MDAGWPWTLEQLHDVLKAMKNNAPGPDRVALNTIRQKQKGLRIFLALLNACILTGKVPNQWTLSRTTFIAKGTPKNGNSASMFRPITMQQTGYKILSQLVYRSLCPFVTQEKAEILACCYVLK